MKFIKIQMMKYNYICIDMLEYNNLKLKNKVVIIIITRNKSKNLLILILLYSMLKIHPFKIRNNLLRYLLKMLYFSLHFRMARQF